MDLACLGLDSFCVERDALRTSSEAELVALASRKIAQIGLVAVADVVEAMLAVENILSGTLRLPCGTSTRTP